MMTARPVVTTTRSMVTAMRLRPGWDSQADGARQKECDQGSSNDAFHVVLLSRRDQVAYKTWLENTIH